jgi:hypothetical protein
MKEGELAVRRHDKQAVGLRDAARNLRQELRARHTHRDRKTDTRSHVVA